MKKRLLADDDIWTYLPHGGLTQLFWVLILALSGVLNGVTSASTIFLLYTPEFSYAEEGFNFTNSFNDSCQDKKSANGSYYVYNKGKNQLSADDETIPTTFGLVCERKFLIGVNVALLCVGSVAAKPVVPWFTKNFGLRSFTISLSCFTALTYVLMAFSPNFIFVLFFRFLHGVTWVSLDILGNIYMSEVLGPSKRHLCGLKGVGVLVGQLLTVAIAFFLPDWRKFSMAIGALHFVCLFMLKVPRSFQNAYGREQFRLGSSILREFGKRVGVPLAEETIQRFEYFKFLKIRQEQRKLAKSQGDNLFHMKSNIGKKEGIFANAHMALVTICATLVSVAYRHNAYALFLLPDGKRVSHYRASVMNIGMAMGGILATVKLSSYFGRRQLCLALTLGSLVVSVACCVLESTGAYHVTVWLHAINYSALQVDLPRKHRLSTVRNPK